MEGKSGRTEIVQAHRFIATDATDEFLRITFATPAVLTMIPAVWNRCEHLHSGGEHFESSGMKSLIMTSRTLPIDWVGNKEACMTYANHRLHRSDRTVTL